MKKYFLLSVAALAAVVFVAAANAWHSNGVTVSAVCNQSTGQYDVSAQIQQSQQWPGAFVKSITPSTFAGTESGSKSVVVKIGWVTSTETQTWQRSVQLAGTCVKPPAPCVPTERIVEKIVYVDRPGPERVVERVVEVPVEKVVEKIVYVEKPVVKVKRVVKKVVRWRTKVVTKIKVVTRVVVKYRKAPKPKVRVKGCRGACETLKQGQSG